MMRCPDRRAVAADLLRHGGRCLSLADTLRRHGARGPAAEIQDAAEAAEGQARALGLSAPLPPEPPLCDQVARALDAEVVVLHVLSHSLDLVGGRPGVGDDGRDGLFIREQEARLRLAQRTVAADCAEVISGSRA